jgi:hypothetical protein
MSLVRVSTGYRTNAAKNRCFKGVFYKKGQIRNGRFSEPKSNNKVYDVQRRWHMKVRWKLEIGQGKRDNSQL